MTVLFERDGEEEIGFDYEEMLIKVVEEALRQEQCPYECEVNVRLTENEGIRRLNQEFRDLDVPTDRKSVV